MIYGKIDLVVPYSKVGVYTTPYSFRLPKGLTAEKVTITNKDRLAVVQVREDDGAFPLDVEVTEQRVEVGFTSFVYVTPITGVRFRCDDPSGVTRLSFTLYG